MSKQAKLLRVHDNKKFQHAKLATDGIAHASCDRQGRANMPYVGHTYDL